SLLLRIFVYPSVIDFANSILGNNPWVIPFSIVISLLITIFCFSLLLEQALKFVPISANATILNKIAGVIPGVISGLLYAALLSLLLLVLPFSNRISNEARDSKVVQQLTLGLEKIENRLNPGFKETVSRTMQMTMIEE